MQNNDIIVSPLSQCLYEQVINYENNSKTYNCLRSTHPISPSKFAVKVINQTTTSKEVYMGLQFKHIDDNVWQNGPGTQFIITSELVVDLKCHCPFSQGEYCLAVYCHVDEEEYYSIPIEVYRETKNDQVLEPYFKVFSHRSILKAKVPHSVFLKTSVKTVPTQNTFKKPINKKRKKFPKPLPKINNDINNNQKEQIQIEENLNIDLGQQIQSLQQRMTSLEQELKRCTTVIKTLIAPQ